MPKTVAISITDLQARFFGAMADPVRLGILKMISQGEKNVSDIIQLLDLPQSRVSNHLACLRHCNLVGTRQEGRMVYYFTKYPEIKKMIAMTEQMVQAHARELNSCAMVGEEKEKQS